MERMPNDVNNAANAAIKFRFTVSFKTLQMLYISQCSGAWLVFRRCYTVRPVLSVPLFLGVPLFHRCSIFRCCMFRRSCFYSIFISEAIRYQKYAELRVPNLKKRPVRYEFRDATIIFTVQCKHDLKKLISYGVDIGSFAMASVNKLLQMEATNLNCFCNCFP